MKHVFANPLIGQLFQNQEIPMASVQGMSVKPPGFSSFHGGPSPGSQCSPFPSRKLSEFQPTQLTYSPELTHLQQLPR